MDAMRRSLVPLALALSLSVAGLWMLRARRGVQPSDRQAMSSAAAHFDSLSAAVNANPAAPWSDDIVVALGYFERQRLGLSNPFRLVAYALDDPRLRAPDRRRVAWALLASLRDGKAYQIDPRVFGDDTARGQAFTDLIDREVRSTPDPRIGELAVRLAFTMAAAGGTIGFHEATIAIQTAALLRDRALSEHDLDALLRLAARDNHGLFTEILRARASRRLTVERPVLSTFDLAEQRQAVARASILLGDLTQPQPQPQPRPRAASTARPSLPFQVANRLATLSLQQPPESPVVVTLRKPKQLSLARSASSSPEMAVTNEEGVVALATARASDPDSARVETARSVLACSVALRVFAQQSPWFAAAHDRTPSTNDLLDRYGLASIAFDARVPSAWRPFYRRELGTALADMRRVLPLMSTDGLHVVFGVDGLPDSALAMHDPKTRTVRLSVYTSGGTLAHELAHDLDWQTARRLYAGGIGYSTDRAVRESRGTLGASVRDLTGRRLPTAGSPGAAGWPSVMRPAEVFARGADWLVASALAHEGRSNGFLSAVQDAELTGYAAGPPTIAGSRPARSAVLALQNMTFVPDSVASGLQRQWGDPDFADPMLLVRRVLEAPVPWRSVWRSSRLGSRTSEQGLPASTFSCRDQDLDRVPGLRLIMLAADSRARGVLAKRAALWSFAQRPIWAHGVLGDAPWKAELGQDVIRLVRRSLVSEVVRGIDGGAAPMVPDLFQHPRYDCDPAH